MMRWFHATPFSAAGTAPAVPVRGAVVLAAYAAIRAVAAAGADPVGAAEAGYLALLVGGVLAAIAVVAPPPAPELGATALFAATAVWIVGYGPHRGALVTLLLVGGLALAAARAGPRGVLGAPGRAAALALGLQLVGRCDLLLPPLLDLRTLTSVLALPVAAGVALHVLSRRFGADAAWVAGAAAVALAPGWNVTVTLALGSLAAGLVAADHAAPAAVRVAAAAALAVPPLWDAALGTLFLLGALTLVVEGRASWLLAAAGIAVLVWRPPVRLGGELLAFWCVALVLVPALAAAPREGRPLVLRGMLLSLVAAMLGGGEEVLAGGLALTALGAGRGGAVGRMQRSWSVLLALGTTILATYPWIRAAPLGSFLELLGLGSPWLAPAAALALVLGGGAGLELWRRRRPAPKAALVTTLAAALALLIGLPSTALVPIPYDPVTLTSDKPLWVHRFAAQEVSGGVVDCHLVHGSRLAAGTRVATVRLRGADRELLGSWEILAGFDTAEWAAARPDVAGIPGFRAPQPWLSQIAPGGGFFSQRYRARFRAARPLAAATIAVRREPDLPPDVELTLYRLELRR